MTVRKTIPQWLLVGLLLLGVALLFVVSLWVGRANGPLFGELPWLWAEQTPLSQLILTEIRLPRSLLGLLVGLSLGLCGAALQGLLRNPLAEPGILGASSGAALGAVLVFYFALGGSHALALPFGGIAGALLSLTVLYLLTGRSPDLLTIILAGVALNAFAGAITSLALNFAPSPYAALEIVFWLLGSLADRSMEHVMVAIPGILIGWLLVLSSGRALDALTLGEDTATTLGFSPSATRFRVIAGTALAVGAAVSVTGVVGFIGLVVPHLIRPLVGHQPSRLLLPSALAGALLTLAADLTIRMLPSGPELKLGVITALIGAPFFLYLIIRARKENP